MRREAGLIIHAALRGIQCTSTARRPTLPLRRSPIHLPLALLRRNLRRGHDGLAGQPRGEPAAAPELAAEAGRGAAQERGRVQLLWPRGQRLRPVALQAADARRGPLLAGPRAVQLPPHDAGAGATPARVLFRRSRVPPQLSSKKRVRNQFFGLRATWNDKQARRRRRARVDARARARRAVGRPLPTSTGAPRRAIAPPPRSRASTSTARSSRTGRARRTSTRPTSRASSPSSSIPGATLASRRRAAPRPAAPGASPRRPRPQVAALLRPAAELVPVDDQGAAPAAQPKPAVSGASARRAGARDAVVSGWLGEARALGSWCSGSSASPGAVAGRLDRPAQSAFEAPVPHEGGRRGKRLMLLAVKGDVVLYKYGLRDPERGTSK